VGDLPTQCSEYDLEKLFNMVGLVRHVRIQRAQGSQASLGYGFVKMSSHQVAAKAMTALDGYLLFGRKLRVRFAGYRMGSSQDEKQQPTNCLYVKFVGLVPGAVTNEEKIREIYAGYKLAHIEVEDIIIRKSAVERNGLQKGYGFIQFAETEEGTLSAVAVINNLSHVHVDSMSYTIEVSKELQQHLIASGLIKHVTNPVASLAGVLGYDSKYVIGRGAGKDSAGRKGGQTRTPPAQVGVSPQAPKHPARELSLETTVAENLVTPDGVDNTFSPTGVEFDRAGQVSQLPTSNAPSWLEMQSAQAQAQPPVPPTEAPSLDLFSLLSKDAATFSPSLASLQSLGQNLVDTGYQTIKASISPSFSSLQNSIGAMGVQSQRSFPRPPRQAQTQGYVGASGIPIGARAQNQAPDADAFVEQARLREQEQLAYLHELERRRSGYGGFSAQQQQQVYYGVGAQSQAAGPVVPPGTVYEADQCTSAPGFGAPGGSVQAYMETRPAAQYNHPVAADMSYSEQGKSYKPSKYVLL